MVLRQPGSSSTTDEHGGRLRFRGRPGLPGASSYTALLYLGQLPARGRVAGNVVPGDDGCPRVLVSLAGVDADGARHPMREVAMSANEPDGLSLPFARGDAVHLLVELTASDPRTADSCHIGVDELSVLE